MTDTHAGLFPPTSSLTHIVRGYGPSLSAMASVSDLPVRGDTECLHGMIIEQTKGVYQLRRQYQTAGIFALIMLRSFTSGETFGLSAVAACAVVRLAFARAPPRQDQEGEVLRAVPALQSRAKAKPARSLSACIDLINMLSAHSQQQLEGWEATWKLDPKPGTSS